MAGPGRHETAGGIVREAEMTGETDPDDPSTWKQPKNRRDRRELKRIAKAGKTGKVRKAYRKKLGKGKEDGGKK